MSLPEGTKDKSPNFELFSGVKTTFDKDCKFLMASVCDDTCEYALHEHLPVSLPAKAASEN